MPTTARKPKKAKPGGDIEMPPLWEQFVAKRDPQEQILITHLLRISERVAALRLGKTSGATDGTTPPSASPVDDGAMELLERIFERLDNDADFAAHLKELPPAFGDGYPLLLLFKTLFGETPKRVVRPGGDPYLTRRQAALLNDACTTPIRSELATRNGITLNALNAHFRNIYRALDVHSQEEAIARAYQMGYLTTHDFHHVVMKMAGGREFRLFLDLCHAVRNVEPRPTMRGYETLGQLGLFLMLMAALLGREESSRLHHAKLRRGGAIISVDAETGKVLRRWDTEGLGFVRCLVVAPAHAAAHGFTPGNIFAVHDAPQRHLNRGAITEFAPDGTRLRTFRGGSDVATRLIGPFSAAFAPDGRLLVTSGQLTDAILAFDAGGVKVTRFADGYFQQIAVTKSHRIAASLTTSLGSAIIFYDRKGAMVETFRPFWQRDKDDRPADYPELREEMGYRGIAADSQGHLLLLRNHTDLNDKTFGMAIEILDADLALTTTIPLPAYTNCLIAADAHANIYAADPDHNEIAVFAPSGHPVRRLPIRDALDAIALLPTLSALIIAGGSR